jgi:CRISPR-associated exonuclease Cas4
MTLPTNIITVVLLLAILLGLLLVLAGRSLRRRRGLTAGETIALDNVTLTSQRLGLTGRMDRLIRSGSTIIPEDWKSARVLRPHHRAQLGVYFLLIEEVYGVRPPHGFIVGGDGTRHHVANTAELRAWVLEIAQQIRAARGAIRQPIPVEPWPGQCRVCSMREHCQQRRL